MAFELPLERFSAIHAGPPSQGDLDRLLESVVSQINAGAIDPDEVAEAAVGHKR